MGLLPNPVGNLPPELRLDGITLPDAQGFWLREQFERGALRDPELIQGLLEQARRSSLCLLRFTVIYCALLCFTVLTVLYFAHCTHCAHCAHFAHCAYFAYCAHCTHCAEHTYCADQARRNPELVTRLVSEAKDHAGRDISERVARSPAAGDPGLPRGLR